MKRTFAALTLVCMACFVMAQKPISDFLNVSGNIKSHYYWRDDLELKKGAPCSLLYVTKLKKLKEGEDPYQVVVIVNGQQQFYIPLDMIGDYFEADVTDKNVFWTMELLEEYPDAFKKDELASLRHERRLDSDQYLSELKKNKFFYDDAAIEEAKYQMFNKLVHLNATGANELNK